MDIASTPNVFHETIIEATYITPIYIGLAGLLLVYLSRRVVNLRNKLQIKMGDGGHTELTAAVRAQDNLQEYLPMAMLLLLSVEMLTFSAWIVHALGIWFLAARLLHLKGIKEPSGKSMARKIGTRLTWAQMTAAALLCLIGTLGGRVF